MINSLQLSLFDLEETKSAHTETKENLFIDSNGAIWSKDNSCEDIWYDVNSFYGSICTVYCGSPKSFFGVKLKKYNERKEVQ